MTLPELDMRAAAMTRIEARRMMQMANAVYAANAATTPELKNGSRALKALLKQLERQSDG